MEDVGSSVNKKGDVLMTSYPYLKKDVMVYEDKKGTALLLNPYGKAQINLSHLTRNEVLVLKQITGSNSIDVICSRLSMDEKTISDILGKWVGQDCAIIKLLGTPINQVRAEEEDQRKYENIYTQLAAEVESA